MSLNSAEAESLILFNASEVKEEPLKIKEELSVVHDPTTETKGETIRAITESKRAETVADKLCTPNGPSSLLDQAAPLGMNNSNATNQVELPPRIEISSDVETVDVSKFKNCFLCGKLTDKYRTFPSNPVQRESFLKTLAAPSKKDTIRLSILMHRKMRKYFCFDHEVKHDGDTQTASSLLLTPIDEDDEDYIEILEEVAAPSKKMNKKKKKMAIPDKKMGKLKKRAVKQEVGLAHPKEASQASKKKEAKDDKKKGKLEKRESKSIRSCLQTPFNDQIEQTKEEKDGGMDMSMEIDDAPSMMSVLPIKKMVKTDQNMSSMEEQEHKDSLSAESSDFIDGWRAKAFSSCAEGPIRTVLTRNFEAIKAIGVDNAKNLECLLFAMGKQRQFALQFDNNLDTDPIRPYFYALNEAIEKTIQTILLKKEEESKLRLQITPHKVHEQSGNSRRFKTNAKEVEQLKTLNCTLCKEKDMCLTSFGAHLKNMHITTLAKAKLALKCMCGFAALNLKEARFHKYSCRQCSLVVTPRINQNQHIRRRSATENE